MTNEKAIMCLEDMKIKVPIPKAAKQARENNEALDVAIKALQSAQPKTNYSESPNTSDCISRQTAIDALDQIFDRCEEIEAHLPEGDPDRTGYKMYPDYMTVWKYLHQLPTAQPEIIRCAECKWFQCNMRQDGYLPKGVDEFECRHWHGSCDPTDFCSQGTRREVTT